MTTMSTSFTTACATVLFASLGAFAQSEQPAPIDPPIIPPTAATPVPPQISAPGTIAVESPLAPVPTAKNADGTPALTLGAGAPPARNFSDFSGEEVGTVIRTLARQAGIGIVVSPKVAGTVTLRLENKSPMQVLDAVCKSSNLFLDHDTATDVYFVRTQEEKAKESTESGSYTFSYAKAKEVLPLLVGQLLSKEAPPQTDERTNTVFYREAKSNLEKIALFLEAVDKPTRQVMIEARLVEVTANPKQSYGINWAGVVGGSGAPQTFKYGGLGVGNSTVTNANSGGSPGSTPSNANVSTSAGDLKGGSTLFGKAGDFLLKGSGAGALNALFGQFAILSVPQMSLTLRMLNEDSDAEFLANPRVVTANNMKATIKIIRNQPVPTLNFNEQTATAVFSGFQDKEFGNTLDVTPSINKDDFVTMSVKPEISNKVGDATFTFAGAAVSSPVIDKRTLESNVLIKSGDTLAIGGLLQDEVNKARTKVPIAGDIPIIGHLFQERINARTKRNLLVFVTPTIIKQHYGTGLEDQVSGLHHSGEEFADPNGWRNNAKGAIRLVPTSHRQVAADYPKPGVPAAPEQAVKYKVTTTERER